MSHRRPLLVRIVQIADWIVTTLSFGQFVQVNLLKTICLGQFAYDNLFLIIRFGQFVKDTLLGKDDLFRTIYFEKKLIWPVVLLF